MKNHYIICGYGRMGEIIARAMQQQKIPLVVVDLDPLKRVLIVRHHRLCRPVWGHIPVQILLNRQGQTGGERVVEACAPLATLRVGVVRIKQHAGTGSKA